MLSMMFTRIAHDSLKVIVEKVFFGMIIFKLFPWIFSTLYKIARFTGLYIPVLVVIVLFIVNLFNIHHFGNSENWLMQDILIVSCIPAPFIFGRNLYKRMRGYLDSYREQL